MKNSLFIFLSLFIVYSCHKPKPFRFALISDTHVSEYGTGAVDLSHAVQDVNAQSDIHFVIISGDITDTNTGDNLIIAKNILDSLDVPYYIIPGNHDTKWSGSGGANFRALWGDDKFSFEYGGYRFIGFHQGPILRMDDGHIPRNILNWLETELKKVGKSQPVILVMHYALTPSVDNWHECTEIIKNYDIRVIIHGHGHRNVVTEYHGIPAIMGRSTLRAGAEKGGYTVCCVQNDSLITMEKLNGEQLSPPWAEISIASQPEIFPVPDSLLPDFSVNNNFSEVHIIWSFSSGYTMTASPIYDHSNVYVGNASGTMYALNRYNGGLSWQYKTNSAIYGTAAQSENRLIFTAADSCIYCLNKDTGTLSWKFLTGDALVSVPVIKENIAFIGASDGVFRTLDIRYGEILWEYKGIRGYVETRPLLYHNLVIFGAWDGRFYALSQDTGEPVWIWEGPQKNPLYSPAACWPVAAYGKIFIAAPDRFIRAIDAQDGHTTWQNNDWKFRETVGLSEDGTRVYARSMTDSVVAFDTRYFTSSVVWAEDFSYGYDIAPSMPIEKNGTLFWGTKNGLICACDAETGKLKWKYHYQNYLINTVAPTSANEVIFSNIDGDVVLLSDSGQKYNP